MVVSRILRDGVISLPGPDTVLQQGDKLLIVTSQAEVETVRIIFGEEIPMHQKDWIKMNESLVTRRMSITKSSLTGKRLKDLRLRSIYGVTVTRVVRSGVELVASPNLKLQMGDGIQVVGVASELDQVAEMVGNKPEDLSHPNLVPIFFGIALGVIFGSIPFHFPGIPQPVKLGLAGGPLIIAILLGHFGPQWHITTYTTHSANMMIREIGISFFLAAVGLGAGEGFVSSVVNGGYWWILYGVLIVIDFVNNNWAGRVAIIASLLNFIIFFLLTRSSSSGSYSRQRINPTQTRRQKVYQQNAGQAAPKTAMPIHRCTICGRTEKDGDNLVFRYCSKCSGAYEYCQDHLFNHTHITQ
jgi:AspT/YidE/YbjL antiporter-like protein